MERRSFIRNASLLAGGSVATASVATACVPTASPKVNVKDFCAVGDDVADDTSAIQTAINSLGTNPGVVYFPPGVYRTTSSITLKPNVALFGDSKDSTAIHATTNGQTIFQMIFGSRADANIEISGLNFDARGTSGVVAISMVHTDYVRLSGLKFTGCDYNVVVDRCVFFSIHECASVPYHTQRAGRLKFHSTTTGPATDYPYVFAVTIENYSVHNNGTGSNSPSISFHRAVGCTLTGLTNSDANFGGSAIVVSYTGDCQGCKFSNSTINAGTAAVYYGPDANGDVPVYCTVTDVDMDQPQTAGVWVQGGSDISVTGCNITASGVSGSVSANGILAAVGERIKVLGCSITGFTAGTGILFGANVKFGKVSSCQIVTCSTGVGVVPTGTATGYDIMGNTFQLVTTPVVHGLAGAGANLIRNNIGVPDLL
jgi:hypothetical protein